MSNIIDDQEGGEALTAWFAKQVEQNKNNGDTKSLSFIRMKYKALRLGKVGVKGRWVTMPANGPGGGGSPVYLDGSGEIEKGPKGTVGKKPDELPKDKPAAEQGPKPIKVPTVAPSPFKTDDGGFEQVPEGFEESFQDEDIPVAKPIPSSPAPLDPDDDEDVKIDIPEEYELSSENDKPTPEEISQPKVDDANQGPDQVEDTPGSAIKSISSIPGFIDKNGKEAIAKLDDTQKLAVKKYTGSTYKKLNEQMRACPPDFNCLSEPAKKFLDVLESAIESAPPLPKPAIVYRGVTLPGGLQGQMVAQLEKLIENGGTYTMPSVTSTTVDPKVARTFGDEDDGIVFRVKAKRGLYVSSISEFPNEAELLQSAKTKYKVLAIEDTNFLAPNGGETPRKVVYLEEE